MYSNLTVTPKLGQGPVEEVVKGVKGSGGGGGEAACFCGKRAPDPKGAGDRAAEWQRHNSVRCEEAGEAHMGPALGIAAWDQALGVGAVPDNARADSKACQNPKGQFSRRGLRNKIQAVFTDHFQK
jgi:hypothetical protein